MKALGDLALSGDLAARVLRAPQPHRARGVRLPKALGGGRLMLTSDPGDAGIFSREVFATELFAIHRGPDGRVIHEHDLGSGLVTNIGVLALANDFAWAQNAQTLKLANNHASGTGTTAAAATDFQLQTPAAPTATAAQAGTQALVSAANLQKYQSTCTLTYTSSIAVTEWGLFTDTTLSATTGTPFTATSATGGTATGTPYTASSGTVQGQQQHIVVPGTTAVWGLITSNTTSGLVIPAWYKQSDGTAGATPGSTEAFSIKPVMWDHKVFLAINVNSGDTIQFVYQLTVQSGG